MAHIMWACWDGGGNLTPSIGIAKELEARGHAVDFIGRAEMTPRIEAAGLRGTTLTNSRTDLDCYAFHPMPSVFGYTSSPAVGEELVAIAAASHPDVVVIDAMFSAALDVAPRFGAPTVVMLHTFLWRIFDAWTANFAMQSHSRERAGFERLPHLDTLWGGRDVFHVNTLGPFDGDPATSWPNVVHGAPVLASERRAETTTLPWSADDPTPIVLLSFSTVPEQRSPEMLQRALDALGELPVHIVATTGGIVEPAELSVPAGAHIVPFANHDSLMGVASLVVGHGGHGTTMRALRHGLPMVGIPAKGADQVPITRLLEEWGVGIALPGDATAPDIRAAVDRVLTDPAYRAAAEARSLSFEGLEGAALAADSIERASRG